MKAKVTKIVCLCVRELYNEAAGGSGALQFRLWPSGALMTVRKKERKKNETKKREKRRKAKKERNKERKEKGRM